jgi:hypothetical protein
MSWQFGPGAAKVPDDEFLQVHADLLCRDERIIDGFGTMAIAWERFAAVDTLIYVDLPLFIQFRWVTKRLIKRTVRRPVRLAEKQSDVEQLHAKLSRALALPTPPHAQVPAARR